jgi:hypothetical protein
LDIYKQIEAKHKAESIIMSCKTSEHRDAAYKYINLYYNKFNDYLGYQHLLYLISEKIIP